MEGNSCTTETIYLDSGESYILHYSTTSSGVNESVSMITDYNAVAYQPLILAEDGTALIREDSTLTIEEIEDMADPETNRNTAVSEFTYNGDSNNLE